jgi:DNA-binding CsgD family transcriptional regulator
MTDTSSKVILLRPSSFEESVEPKLLVKGLIGPGVTVIATPQDKNRERYLLCEQMASAVSKGEKFLGLFETRQCHVMLVAHGQGDFYRMEERGVATRHKNLVTRDKWPKIGLGCIKKLKAHKRTYPDFKLAFLGDFHLLKSILGNWIENELKIKDQGLLKSYPTNVPSTREMEINNVRRLRNFCFENGVSIIVGHDLRQDERKLISTWGLYKCDTEIHLREKNNTWSLSVIPKENKNYIPTNSWNLTFDSQNCFRVHEKHVRETREMEARSKGQLPLNDKEMKIIDAMWGQGPMSVKQIAVATDISRSTVDQKLKALEGSNKGHWVVSLKGDKGKEYMVDTTKERDWI